MKAMIFAAGLGTRLQPVTNDKPKALVEIQGRPLLEIIILRLMKYGFNKIVINVHHYAEKIKKFLTLNENFGAEIFISDESDKLLDTGGGLKNAKQYLEDEPFLVHNVDILSDINLSEMFKFHNNGKALSTVAVRKRPSSRYLLFDENNNLCGWKNIKTSESIIVHKTEEELTPFAFSGIHIIDPKIFGLMPDEDKFSVIDVYLNAAKDHIIKSYQHDNSFWADVGRIEDLNSLNLKKSLDSLF